MVANVPDESPVAVEATYLLSAAGPQAAAGLRRPAYISTSNTSIAVTVTPVGGSTTSFGPSPCTSGSCPISFTAVPGPNVLKFSLTDGGGVLLSTFTTTQIIQPAAINSLSFTAKPVVNNVTLALTAASVNAGSPASDTLTVNARDADNNIIVGTANYTDASGNPLALQLNVSNVKNGGSGLVTLAGPVRITAPNQAVVTAKYNGGWLDHAVIGVSSTATVAGSLGTVTLTATPHVIEYSSGISAGAQPHGISPGPDGNVWFTEYGGARIGRMTTSGTATEFSSGVLTNPVKIVEGNDGNLWFGYAASSKTLARISPAGTVATVATLTDADLYGIVPGPDGNMWVGELASGNNGNIVARVTDAGGLTEFTTGITAGAGVQTLTLGPDGNFWFPENAGNRIGRITPAGAAVEFSAGITAGAQPFGIASGADGNLWFTEYAKNKIGRITPAGTVTEFGGAGTQPRNIVAGPDGNLWFNDDSGGELGRITPAGTVTLFPAIGYGGGRIIDLCVGPDGNIWFSAFGDNKVGKFVY